MSDVEMTSTECAHESGEETIITEDFPNLARLTLRGWLNRLLRVILPDGRILIGLFLCTDRDANIILGSCTEYTTLHDPEPRFAGLVMIPRRHIVAIHLDVLNGLNCPMEGL